MRVYPLDREAVLAQRARRQRLSVILMWIGIALVFAVIVISFASQGVAFYVVGAAGILVLSAAIGTLVNA